MGLLSVFGSFSLLIGRALTPAADLEPSGAYKDSGGNPVGYAKAVDRLIRSGDEYVAPLICNSAATMLLKAPNVIWRPKTSLGVHSASVFGAEGDMVEPFNRLIASYYPRRMGEWFMDEGPGRTRSTELVRFTPQEIVDRFGAHLTIRPFRDN